MRSRASKPSEAEVRANPRSRSAVMRVAERTGRRHEPPEHRAVLGAAGELRLPRQRLPTTRGASTPSSTPRATRGEGAGHRVRAPGGRAPAQATPLKVERLARDRLAMRNATPAVTQYVSYAAAAAWRRRRETRDEEGFAPGLFDRVRPHRPMRNARAAVRCRRAAWLSDQPLLASKTPPWRSKFIVGLVARLHRAARRALYIQVLGNAFFQRQGEIRFARNIDLPAGRGRILDRNGQILAVSVPFAVDLGDPEGSRRRPQPALPAARALGMSTAELDERLAAPPELRGCAARSTNRSARTLPRSASGGVHQEQREYKRKYPGRGPPRTWSARPTPTSAARRASSSRTSAALAGNDGKRRVIKDARGRVVGDIGESRAAGRRPATCADHRSRRSSSSPTSACATRWSRTAPSGSVVVLDAQTGGVLAMANYPSFVPEQRRHGASARRNSRSSIPPSPA